MGCIGILLGPLSGISRGGWFFAIQIIAFLIATAAIPGLFWAWWIGCGIWTASMFDSDGRTREQEISQIRSEDLQNRVEELESKLEERGIT